MVGAGSGSGPDEVDVDGSVTADVDVCSDDPAASGSAEVDPEQPTAASRTARAAQRTAFKTQRQSTATSSTGSSKPLSVSRRGSESA